MNDEFEPNRGGMPTAQLAEESVLCAMMRYPQQFVSLTLGEGIDASHFFINGEIYRQVVNYAAKFPDQEEIDVHLFVQELQLNGSLSRCGGPSAIANLIMREAVEHRWRDYANQLREAKARRIATLAVRTLADAADSEEAITATKATLEALMAAMSSKGRSRDAKDTGDEFIARWTHDHDAGEIPGSSTGFAEIDNISGGMRPGELWVVGGKSTRGKSVFMMQTASIFMSRGENVAIFSLEMMAHEVTGRLVCVLGGVKYGAITQPRTADKHDRAGILRGVKDYKESSVWIDDTSNQTIDWIEAEAQRISDTAGGLGLIVIDYIQLIHAAHEKGVSRETEVARISKGMKQLAKRLRCPVLSATQLNEEGRSRESKAIEQDADALLYICEDGIKVCKMRNGKRDSVLKLFLNGEKQLFTMEQRP